MLAYAVPPTLTATDAYTAAHEKCEHLIAHLPLPGGTTDDP